jgi:hypothetical protein
MAEQDTIDESAESLEESSAVMWSKRLFPGGRRVPGLAMASSAVLALLVILPMLETPYAPGIGWRVAGSALALVASAWALGWVLVRRAGWLSRILALLVLAVALPLFAWAVSTLANPLAGPIGNAEDPAFLAEQFEIVVAEGAAGDTYAVVSGTVLSLQEVALDRPYRDQDGYDYDAAVRCWAVQIELVSRLDTLLLDPDQDRVRQLLRPTVWLTTPDGTEGTAAAWDNTHCEKNWTGRATSNSYRTPSVEAGLTVYSFWVTVSLPTRELPSMVRIGVNESDDVSYFLPQVTPEACSFYDFCGGLLTLADQDHLHSNAVAAVNEFQREREQCSPPNVPEEWCG